MRDCGRMISGAAFKSVDTDIPKHILSYKFDTTIITEDEGGDPQLFLECIRRVVNYHSEDDFNERQWNQILACAEILYEEIDNRREEWAVWSKEYFHRKQSIPEIKRCDNHSFVPNKIEAAKLEVAKDEFQQALYESLEEGKEEA